MGRHKKAAFLALATAIAGVVLSALPSVRALEDELGLGWLFATRGAAAPPTNVVIVNTDDASVQLDLPGKLVDWPRARHADLVDKLVDSGASAIAFDVTFAGDGQSSGDNQIFADSISKAGRIVLAQLLSTSDFETAAMVQLQNPKAVLANAARGLAPAPVPDLPLVFSSWRFIDTTIDQDVPTLPSVLLQVHGLPSLDAFVGLLRRAGLRSEALPRSGHEVRTAGDLLRFMQTVRRELKKDSAARAALPSLAAEVPSSQANLLRVLARLYTGDDVSYLNYYGPPRSICTVSYATVILHDVPLRCPLRNSLVLVGGATGGVRKADQDDTYNTVFDQPTGVELSGVEIHATALANLLAGTSLRVPSVASHVMLLALMGGLLGATGYYVRTRRRLRPGAVTARIQAAIVVLGLALAYLLFTAVAFQTMYLVLPLVVPLAIQLPLALTLSLVVRPAEYEEQVEAVCLATDAAGSTAVGQHVSHRRYARLMNDYNQALRAPVIARGGATLEPQGDGFVCLWCAPGKTIDTAMRQLACTAALEIADASQRFNMSQPDGEQLPTRVGLNLGTVTVYSDADRGVFKAFGDAVNVAARLRDLNVELGTHVLGCDRVVEDLSSVFAVRPMPGPFSLKGIVHSTPVFEINRAMAPHPRSLVSRL